MSTNLPRALRLLEEGCTARLHLGAQLVVWHRGALVDSLAFGERRPGEPMTADTLMLWLSAGKPLTVVAVAQQWERGRLDLDAPVAALLPEFSAGGKAGITPRHLLTHTAGLRLADLELAGVLSGFVTRLPLL
ncbi:MAG TPA: serine hydrolase domain-containing protein, partial [Verrucomicrobiota bacterium]|nr:serine hydrolase domain-containing protein [Verrucomicrobiota bacterium]